MWHALKVFQPLSRLPLGFFSQTGPPHGLVKNRNLCRVGNGMWPSGSLLEGSPWEGAGCILWPPPLLQPHLSWQTHHPPFLLATLLPDVCVWKTTIFFGQAVLTGVWSLNSNWSLIAFFPTNQNLPSLPLYFGLSRCKLIRFLFYLRLWVC